MFCPNCGTKNEDGARFCSSCGTPLERKDDTPQTQLNEASARPVEVPNATPPNGGGAARATETATPAATPKKALPKWLPFAIGGAVALLAIVLVVALLPRGESSGNAPANGGVTGTETGAPRLDDGSWTVLAYVCGANLESEQSQATDNLKELASVDLPNNVHFVIQTGGAYAWHTEGVDANKLGRYLMKDGELELQEQLEWASMGKESTLSDFLSWGTKAFPAEHYMVVFWDHGGGPIGGVCMDEVDDDGIVLPEMRKAFAESGVHYDVVAFDTCLSATLETAVALSESADYLVASEEIVPGGGIAWDSWPKWFASTKDPDDAKSLCVGIVDTYMEKTTNSGVVDAVTLSVTDLSHAQEVMDAFNKAGEAMARSTEDAGDMQYLVVRGRDAEAYGYANYWEGYTNVVDAGDLLKCMSERLKGESDALQAALANAVVYERHGSARNKATGLSVFYPLVMDGSNYMAYVSVCRQLGLGNDAYLQYLSARTGNYNSSTWKDKGIADLVPVTAADAVGAFQYQGAIDADGSFSVHITGNTEFVQIATYSFGQVQPDGTVVPLGTGNDLNLDIDDRGQITYTDHFQGGVLNIGGAYCYARIVDMVSEDGVPSYNLYSVPIELTTTNARGEEVTLDTNLLVSYDYPTHKYVLECYYEDVDETGLAGKSILQLRIGDKMKFLVAREVNGQTQTGSTGTITLTQDTVVEELNPGDASYVYQITITDIFGQKYEPVSALITYKDGKRTAQLM